MRYIALLRAVNVGGRTVKMDRLRALFEEIKLKNVETFIASGNVIFEATVGEATLESKIERHLAKSLGFDVPTLVRSATDFAAVAASTPFDKHPPITKAGAIYVGFLKSAPSEEGMTKVNALASAGTVFALRGRELWWRAEDRRAVLEIPIAKFERALGCETTFRNETTVRKVAERYCR
ncbi:MAG TPA: DUF1697 domain-containing protein [Gemmatimonadaceae bacterium]|jgi:uncharacterized protein (DUF1697 family)